MDFKGLFKNKPVGFYVTLGTIGLALITAIAYLLSYNNTDNFNVWAFVVLLVSFVVSVVLVLLKQFKVVPYALGFLNFVAFLFYVYGIYYYVSVVLVGIDLDHFEPEFFVSTIAFVLLIVGSCASIFMKQVEENVEEGVAE